MYNMKTSGSCRTSGSNILYITVVIRYSYLGGFDYISILLTVLKLHNLPNTSTGTKDLTIITAHLLIKIQDSARIP